MKAVMQKDDDAEDAIMQTPPRDEHAHMVGLQMMIVAYGSIAIFETVGAYLVFVGVF